MSSFAFTSCQAPPPGGSSGDFVGMRVLMRPCGSMDTRSRGLLLCLVLSSTSQLP